MTQIIMVLAASAGAFAFAGSAIAAAVRGDYGWALGFGIAAAMCGSVSLTRGDK